MVKPGDAVRLKRDIEVNGAVVPAGTECEVRFVYLDDDDEALVVMRSGLRFMVLMDEIEEAK